MNQEHSHGQARFGGDTDWNRSVGALTGFIFFPGHPPHHGWMEAVGDMATLGKGRWGNSR